MKKLLIATLSSVTAIAHAHPGHDHSHWMSQPIHWLTAMSVVAIVAVAAYQLKKRSSQISSNDAEGK